MYTLLFSLLHLVVISIFPGIFMVNNLKNVSRLFKLVVSVFFSIAFWIVFVNVLALFKIPLYFNFYFLLVLFIIFFIFKWKRYGYPFFYKTSFRIEHIGLLIFVLLYFLSFLFSSIPPGGDISMHGYITKLILIYNGLPNTYEPMLPYSNFGAYSTGYHIINALISGLNEDHLQASFRIMSVVSYPLCILSIVILLSQFVKQKTAIYTSVICFSIASTIQLSISWGGNPTVFSFDFCLVSVALFLYSVKNKNVYIFLLNALCLVSIPLTHAIPTITFFYLTIVALPFYFIFFIKDKMWIMKNGLLLMLFSVMLLIPFIVSFKNDNSIALLDMIRGWQQNMTHFRYTSSFYNNLWITLLEIRDRTEDYLIILSGISILVLLVYKKFKQVGIIVAFFLLFYFLFLNSNYWVLPFSELLYPERVVFFSIIIMFFPVALLFDLDENQQKFFLWKKRKIKVSHLIIFGLLFFGVHIAWNRYTLCLKKSLITMNENTKEAFGWIKDNTQANAIFKVSYNDVGMWIPAFTNRKTINTHIHFIHEVAHTRDSIIKMTAYNPTYYFITKRDLQRNLECQQEIPLLICKDEVKDKKIVYQNKDVVIYK